MIDCFGTAHASQNPKHCDLPDIHELRQSIQQFVATHCEASGRCKGWATKASFRAEWAKSALSNLQTSKQHSKSYQEVEVSRGTYLSFEKIWDEGCQDQDDSNAAMLYCARATKLGGKWTRLNGMTDRVEFLYLRNVFTETLSEKWAMYLTQREESQASSSSGQPIAPCAGSTPATRATPAKMSRKRSVDELDAPSSLKSVIASDLYSQCNSVFLCLFRLLKHFSWTKVETSYC